MAGPLEGTNFQLPQIKCPSFGNNGFSGQLFAPLNECGGSNVARAKAALIILKVGQVF